MATIRRFYIFIVCFISLQSVIAAINTLIGGVARWLLGADTPDALSFTFQLAVIIVGSPIFIGHWLWAVYLARKDPAELNAWARHIYLYLTKGNFGFYVGAGVFTGLGALITAALPFTDPAPQPLAELLSSGLQSSLMTALTAGLWFYHERLTADKNLNVDWFYRFIRQIYLLFMSGCGLVVGTVGLIGIQIWVFHRLDGQNDSSLAALVSTLVVGGLVWLAHEWQRARNVSLNDSTTDVMRWVYALGVSGLTITLAVIGLIGSQIWLFQRINSEPTSLLPDLLAVLIASLPVLIYHELASRRVLKDNFQPFYWLYALIFNAAAMIGMMIGLIITLQWLFSVMGGRATRIPEGAALFIPSLIVWGYHHWILNASSKALGLNEDSSAGFRGTGRLVRRLYVLGFSGLGISLAAFGLIALQEWAYSGFGAVGIFGLPEALAFLAVGVLAWLYYWRWAGQLFASPIADERRSDLRKAYLYFIIYVTVNTAVITIALLVNGILRALLGLPTTGSVALPLAIIITSTALWIYHALVLRSDIGQAGESALQAGMQRLYWYLVAALGLGAFIVGLAGELSAAIRWLSLAFRADASLKESFAGFTAALVAGLPVWLSAWIPAQWAAMKTDAIGTASRSSLLRKLYLYFYSLTAVVTTLITAVTVVYQVLNAIFGLFGGTNLIGDIAQSIGFTVIATMVWLYHGWVLRGDGQLGKADKERRTQQAAHEKEVARQKLAADWAAFPVAVVDGGDGAIGKRAVAALKHHLPYLNLIPIGLSPESSAALGVEFNDDPLPRLDQAVVIVTSSLILMSEPALAARPTPKIVVPINTTDLHWAGLASIDHQGSQIVSLVKELLKSRRVAAEAAPTVLAAST
jgi:hypothetical protein